MIKEILKGNNNPFKADNQNKKKIGSMKGQSKRINSVLNDFITFRKINLKKNIKPYLFEKTNSVKIIISKKKPNNQLKNVKNNNNNSLGDSKNSFKKSIINGTKNNNQVNKSYTVKRKKDLSSEISNLNSANFDERRSYLEKTINRTEKLSDKYLNDNFFNIYSKPYNKEENGNGCNKKKKVFVRNNNNAIENLMFINNLEQEFQIRILKKRIKKLKDINMSLKLKLDNIMEKNYLLESDTLKEQKKRENIIFSSMNIFKTIINKDEYVEEYGFKNLLLNLMDLKYNYENAYLNNNFLSSVQTLFKLSNILNDNKNMNNTENNNIYYNIKKIVRLKNKYINDIKQYNILKMENKKYYNYFFSLGKTLNINNLDELERFLKSIKSSNDDQIRKIIKMKNVLFDENTLKKRKININSSVDNIQNHKRYKNINFNYTDLQKYFLVNNKRYYFRNNNSAKVSNIDIRKFGNKNNNNLFSCLTEKANHRININNGNGNYENKTNSIENNKINYYNNKRIKILNNKYDSIENNLRKNKRIKTNNNIYLEKKNDNNNNNDNNKNNYLYYSYKNKIMNLPYNHRTYNPLEDKRINNDTDISTNHFTCYNDKESEKKIKNRINYYAINQINNKLNNSIDINFLGIPDSNNTNLYQKGNYSKDENYPLYNNDNDKKQKNNNYNCINIKKKTFNLKNISFKNYGTIQNKQ